MEKRRALPYRIAPLEMTPSEFRKAGYRLIDQVAEWLCTLPERPVAPNESLATLRALLGSHSLPEQGRDASSLLDEAADLLFNHSAEGMRQLHARTMPEPARHLAHADYVLDLHLTKRELDVLRLVSEGQTDREVAEALVISSRTVNRHLSNIFVKLDVPGRAAAVAYAIRQGLVG
ncbi:MAG: hypothetical protein NVSMB27_11530 [Ktedonobacteraceae bacterium]